MPTTFVGARSERKAWRRVATLGQQLRNDPTSSVAAVGTELYQLATGMLTQLAGDVHTNPAGWDEAQVMSRRVMDLSYRHVKDDKPYLHSFGPGVKMIAVQKDRQQGLLLVHHRGLPLWKEFTR